MCFDDFGLFQLCSLSSEKTKPALPQRANSQPALDFDGRPLPTVDELSLVGYPDDVEVSQLFEKNGMRCLSTALCACTSMPSRCFTCA